MLHDHHVFEIIDNRDLCITAKRSLLQQPTVHTMQCMPAHWPGHVQCHRSFMMETSMIDSSRFSLHPWSMYSTHRPQIQSILDGADIML